MIENEREFFQLHTSITETKISFKKGLAPLRAGISLEEAQRRIEAGKHVLDFETIQLPEEKLRRLFDGLISILEKTEFHEASDVDELKSALKAGELDLKSLTEKVFSGDSDYINSVSKKLVVSFDLLLYLGTNLANPFLELFAERLEGRLDLENWLEGSCPLCGSEPVFAKLRRDDGKRILWCQFCGTEWEYLRIKCPFCSTENHKSLKYLFTEEESRYRVYLCDECKRYIKTADERVIPEEEKLDFSFESARTLHLDLLAQKDGYRSRFSLEQAGA